MPPEGGHAGVYIKIRQMGYRMPMKRQVRNRLGVAHVRDTVAQWIAGTCSMKEAMDALSVSRATLYNLRTSLLRAKGLSQADTWSPSVSGGNHKPEWPQNVVAFLERVLGYDENAPHYSYAFAASEVRRLFNYKLSRVQVRAWAIRNGFAQPPQKPPRQPAHTRRWQRQSIGELWQMDATPDYFAGKNQSVLHLIDILDDCSRMQVGGRLYWHENTLSYMDILYRAFNRYGLPLVIYVDRAGFFKSKNPNNLTQLETILDIFDISFVTANSPQAKGKIERVHQIWQERLPAYCAMNNLVGDINLDEINHHLELLIDYRNGMELHREIGRTARDAWDSAISEGRNKLRPVPRGGWWELAWVSPVRIEIGPMGRAIVNGMIFPTACARGTRAWLYPHLDGTYTIAMNRPNRQQGPQIVFTNNPRVR